MTNKQPEDWREARRLHVWELKQQGWKAARIAKALGVPLGVTSTGGVGQSLLSRPG